MTDVLMYWSHICVLHNEEKRVISEVQKALIKQNINLRVEYFGLGYANRMSEYVAQENSVLPDIVVSADLEMFEHKALYNKLGELHKSESWHPLKKIKIVEDTRRKDTLLPLLAIPMVCYTNDLSHCENKALSEIVEHGGFAFGGINNSAGKTITKLALEKYSDFVAEKLLDQSAIEDMPIGAFQSVRTNKSTTAVVPLLYAMRADGVNTFVTTLKDGVILIPSYFACRTKISEEIGKIILSEIFTQTFCNMYSSKGNMIVCLDKETDTKVEDNIDNYSAISQSFIDKLSDEKFYNLYTSKINSAKMLKVCV